MDVSHIEDRVSMSGPQSSRPDHFDQESDGSDNQDDDFDQDKSDDIWEQSSPILFLVYSHVASATGGTHQETL